MGPVPKEDRSDPGRSNKDESLMEPGFAVMENDATDSDDENSDDGDIVNQGYQLLSQDPDVPVDQLISQDLDVSVDQLISQDPDHQIIDEDLLGASASAQQPIGGQPEISAQLAHVLPKEIPKPDRSTIVTHTDSPESLKHRRERMANDDLIKCAMSGIKLPTTGVPNWANFVQEKDWKTNLMRTIQKEETKEGNDADKNS